jgi:hypothetical protein
MADVAYLVLAHEDPAQFGRLARALDQSSRLFVHVDAKCDETPFRAQDLPDGIEFARHRIRVSWAAWSVVEATLRLVALALDSKRDFSHLVLLSGLDYPIQPARRIAEHLAARSDHEFIRFIDGSRSPHYRIFHEHYWFLEESRWLPRGADRILRRGAGRVLRRFVRKPQPPGLVPYWGSMFWALTPGCARHVLEFLAANPTVANWARTSFAPDEHLVHTIIGNSRYLDRSDGIVPLQGAEQSVTYRLANLHLIHPSLRKVHTEGDFDELASSERFFVRKLRSRESGTLLDRIDRELLA